VKGLETLARSNEPVIVGPFTGEVGYELLYWIPFVRWAAETYGLMPDRLIVVSRGGVRDWYGTIATRYVDILSWMTPTEFREAKAGYLKQKSVSAFDTECMRKAAAKCGVGDALVLHPELMYRTFKNFFVGRAKLDLIEQHTRYARIVPQAVESGLPGRYTATRFYVSEAMPDSPAVRTAVAGVLASLPRPLVRVESHARVDSHEDINGPSDYVVGSGVAPERNLAVQTAAIAGAQEFIGTYGGFSYLAPFCGVPTRAFFSRWHWKTCHLEAAAAAFDRIGGPSWVIHDIRDTRRQF
jgi:hypothetical protein